MAALSGQPSSLFSAQGEMVGLGTRRKVTRQSRVPYSPGEDYAAQNSRAIAVNLDNLSLSGSVEGITRNGLKKRERRHVYYDIMPLKLENSVAASRTGGKSTLDLPTTEKSMANVNSKATKPSEKPAIPPKPKYIFCDKRTRHVYQTIDFPVADGLNSVIPPPLPAKPAGLKRSSNIPNQVPPPLPPRVVNEDAIRQRHKLDQEYFENLRKSVDEELLGLAEEGDLPVPVHMSNSIPVPQTQRLDSYGMHSPPQNMFTAPRGLLLERPTRRHSLPLYQSITDENSPNPRSGQPHRAGLPVRDNSHDINVDEEVCMSHSSEVNLAQNLLLLKRCGWYWGNMTWQEAEALLACKEGEGAFLMRDSQNPLHLLTITVRSTTNTVHHVRVEYSEGKFQLYEPGRMVSRSAAQCVRHSNIKQFINLAIKHSISGSFLYFLKPKNMGEPPVQIRLLSPISRLLKLKSLKYICRMAIRNCVVADLIPSIHLPPRLQQYLMSGPYYDPDEDI